MKRYYSHYTFIYPDIYLKNHIVEMDSDGHIVNCFPFEKEIERTEFYSGVLAFIPQDFSSDVNMYLINIRSKFDEVKESSFFMSDSIYNLYDETGMKLVNHPL